MQLAPFPCFFACLVSPPTPSTERDALIPTPFPPLWPPKTKENMRQVVQKQYIITTWFITKIKTHGRGRPLPLQNTPPSIEAVALSPILGCILADRLFFPPLGTGGSALFGGGAGGGPAAQGTMSSECEAASRCR